ncbi:MAG: HAD family hydrolase [Planctomycetota bacterium]
MFYRETSSRAVIENQHIVSPIATGVAPVLKPIDDIRAVVFDIYGTLVISGTGDVGSVDTTNKSDAMRAALLEEITDLETRTAIENLRIEIDDLHAIIRDHQSRITDRHHQTNAKSANTEGSSFVKAEIDIVAVWRQWLAENRLGSVLDKPDLAVQLAARYESLANPVCPMPHATNAIDDLRDLGMVLGIVSNAQHFTLQIVQHLMGDDLDAIGFDPQLCIFSNRFACAKPDRRLFDQLANGLEQRGISPLQSLYVGNDMLNDVWTAGQVGMRTALFAADTRSLRLRANDERCRNLKPDLTLTCLSQLSRCI